MPEDSRRNAARYRLARDSGASGSDESRADASGGTTTPATREQRAAYVETVIDQAIRAGDFDDLPGAGKPLTGLGSGRLDPDWWIRRKIENEKLDILGPPALALRTEHARLDARLDRMHREHEVREVLEDFNRRVIEARRQLQGGPPVVTPVRDVDAEVAAWRQRRETRIAAAQPEPDPPRPGWRERRRARRDARRRSTLEP